MELLLKTDKDVCYNMNSTSVEKIQKLLNDIDTELSNLSQTMPITITDDNAPVQVSLLKSLRDMVDIQTKSLNTLQSIVNTSNTNIQKYVVDTEEKLVNLLKTMNETPNNSFADVTKKSSVKTVCFAPTSTTAVIGAGLKQSILSKLPEHKYQVCKNISIPAYPIKSAIDCHKYKGYWCWNASDNRFWISINGLAVPGFVTTVHAANSCPTKFTEYDHQKNRDTDKINNYYKPPELYPGSCDIRHLTDRLRYHNDSNKYNNDQFIIRVSDADHVANDINMLTDKDARLMCDITSHYMMIGYLVRSLYK